MALEGLHLEGLRGKRVLCAVSGGADSVALLRLLTEARDRGEITLFAAHFEHGIRAGASLEDMRFVKKLCAELDVALLTGRANVPAEAKKAHEGIESCARRLRHEFLEKARVKLKCDCVALAHHRQDRAETVLMHILRGSGLKGAAAMPYQSAQLVRPLIDVSPDEIRRYLSEIGQDWREDETNGEADNPRNALRLKVFPLLKDIYPGFEAALSRFAEISGEEDRLLEALTDEYMEGALSNYAGIWVLKKGERALQRRCLKRLLPWADYAAAERALSAGKTCDIGEGFRAAGDGENVYLIPPFKKRPKSVKLRLSGETALEGVCRVTAEDCPAVPVKNNGFTQVLNKAALKDARLRLRFESRSRYEAQKSFDYICPLGMGKKRKTLGDYLTDRHFPEPLRASLPLIAAGREILWVPGVGISEKAKIRKGDEAVRLTIEIAGGKYDD